MLEHNNTVQRRGSLAVNTDNCLCGYWQLFRGAVFEENPGYFGTVLYPIGLDFFVSDCFFYKNVLEALLACRRDPGLVVEKLSVSDCWRRAGSPSTGWAFYH